MKTVEEIAEECMHKVYEELEEASPCIQGIIESSLNQALKPSQDLLNEVYDALNEALVEEPIKNVTNDYTLRLESVFNKVGEFLGK